jgi:hypothetical protein
VKVEDEWEETPKPTVGSAAGGTEEPSEAAEFAGSLIVPDIEARQGWRQYYVKKASAANTRTVGFRK